MLRCVVSHETILFDRTENLKTNLLLHFYICSVYITKRNLSTWLSLVMFLMESYVVLSCFPREILDEICDRIESVLENFIPTFMKAVGKETV